MLDEEQQRLAAETPFSGPRGTLPGTLSGGQVERNGARTIVHRAIPMSTDYQAIEDAFDNRAVQTAYWNRQARDGGMD